ncbi:MAG: hypothetical protein WKF91_12250 [Segetibacter sp.]
MKKFITIVFFLVISIIFFACQKETNHEQVNISVIKSELAPKVNKWLDQQKSTYSKVKSRTNTLTSSTSNKDANIDLLKENLDFTGARTEQLDNTFDLLLVPIKDEVINKKNLDKNSTLTLLLITDKLGKISSGSIVYFLPSDGKKHNSLPQNTFTNMFSGKAVGLDGVYKILSVTGRWFSQLEIKKGRLFATGSIEQKNKTGRRNQKTSSCIDWYLVTTYHYSDGSSYQTEEYIGTTCDGCDDPDYQSVCPDGGGGDGGGDEGDVNPVEESQAQMLTTSTASAPDYGGGPNGGGGTDIATNWHALALVFSVTRQGITFVTDVTPGRPFPAPTLVPFWSNTYGDMVCHFSCGSWDNSKVRVSNIAFMVSWRWDEVRTYLKQDGSSLDSQIFPGKTAMKLVSK